MQVATDPVAFLDDGQVGGLLVQLGIVYRDARMQGKQLDEPLIGGGELGGTGLVGQIEVADGLASRSDWDAQK